MNRSPSLFARAALFAMIDEIASATRPMVSGS
jgi:hypothetical protein